MKANRIVFSLLITLFLMDTIHAQRAMFKGAVLLLFEDTNSYAVADAGFEIKLNKNISTQISFSARSWDGDSYHNTKTVWSLQSRYYFKGDRWNQSPFVGVVLQKFYKYKSSESSTQYNVYTLKKTDKVSLGPIFGKNIIIYKRFGLDIHAGIVAQLGDEMTTIDYNVSSKPNEITNKKNVVNARPFAGFNLYFAIGKMPPKVEKKKPAPDSK